MSPEFQYDVFLSHSHKDEPAAREIAERLRGDGLKVWFDDWEIKPGESIPFRIDEGLEQSRIIVFCMSANTFDAEWPLLEGYTHRFRDPLNKQRRFIPVRLDDAPVKPMFEQLLHIRWISKERESEYPKLLAACQGRTDWTARRQRICMISSEYPPHILGGLGVHVSRLSAELAALADVDLVLPHVKDGYATPPRYTQVRSLAQVGASYDDPISWLHFAQHASDLIDRLSPKPEVIHCHDWVTVLAGLRSRHHLKIPLVFHVHLPNRTPFCASVENLGILCADLVTVNSQAMLEQIRDRFPKKQIAVIPNGVDTTLFRPDGCKTDREPYVLFVGRLVEQKGVEYLLRAFVHVRKRYPDLQLKIVGSGPCKTAYHRLADCLLLGEQVKFLGWQTGADLRDLYQSAAVVALPSVYEPFGMTALEAMACACPVVASNTGGLKEIIRHLETGCLVEPRDHLDLAQWIIHLLAHPDLRQHLASQACRIVHETGSYQWSSIAREYAAFYYKLSCTPLDTSIPDGARDYFHQIRDLGHRLDPSLYYYFFETIFDWIK